MIFDVSGNRKNSAYRMNGLQVNQAFDINGNVVFNSEDSKPDYTSYSYIQKWGSKGIGSTQGFAILDDMVFWVSKSGDSSIPANCYVWNLSDGSQALDRNPITIYSGHGNSLSFDFPKLYAATAYMPSKAYVNTMTDDYTATLTKTLMLDSDGSRNCDVCIDEEDKDILWSLAHTAGSSDTSAPFYISKWNLNNLTDNGDGTYTPELLQTVETPQPSNSFYIQGCYFHDNLLWYASGYSGSSRAYVYAVDPNTGEVMYTIDLETTSEPEGVAFYPDEESAGGYAMYVGFQNMVLRKYTFNAL